MANKHGDFIWYELMTSDADGAREFIPQSSAGILKPEATHRWITG